MTWNLTGQPRVTILYVLPPPHHRQIRRKLTHTTVPTLLTSTPGNTTYSLSPELSTCLQQWTVILAAELEAHLEPWPRRTTTTATRVVHITTTKPQEEELDSPRTARKAHS